ncbi:MAG: hypothetical protein CM1200mP18_08340 [Gammaproteobacteria bacterium]|nr:MAG: hypothetical protein CM1200mP18_08340 [Gammaproteobacteria bacterium]
MIIVVQLQVPFASLLAWFSFKERLGWHRALGIVLAFAGVTVIAGSPKEESALTGISLVVMGAFVWAVGQMLFKRLSGMGGLRLITWVAVMAGPQLLLFSRGSWKNGQLEAVSTAKTIHWLTVAYLVLVLTVIGYSCWYFLLARYGINQVVPFLFLEPLSAVAGGVLLLGEVLSTNRLLGGVAVLSGVALITFLNRPDRKQHLRSLSGPNNRGQGGFSYTTSTPNCSAVSNNTSQQVSANPLGRKSSNPCSERHKATAT